MSAAGGVVHEVLNPATEAVVASVPEVAAAEAEEKNVFIATD